MKSLIQDMGKRGLSCVLKSEMRMEFFCLQSRGCDKENAELLMQEMRGKLPKINLVSQIGIKFCPFCGLRLEDWLFANRKEALLIIEDSKQFLA